MSGLVPWLSLIWLPILFYVMLQNETKFKKNIAIGVTFPFEGRRHPDVLNRLEQFKKQELLVCIGLMVCAVPGMFIKDFSSNFALWFTWMDLAIVLPIVPYVLCNRDLKRIKAEHNWGRPDTADTITVDLSAMPEIKWLSPWAFIPAVLLCLLPILWDKDFGIMYISMAVCIALFWFGYRYLYRNKAERVDNNVQLTIALSRMRRCYWGRMWLLVSYFMAVMCIGYSLLQGTAIIAVTLVSSAILIIFALGIEFRVRKVQETLTAQSGKDFYVDEDDYWLGGIIYYNPNDSRFVINNRIGTNSSFNLAHIGGKITAAVTVLLLLILPFTGYFITGDGTVTAELTETELVAKAGWTSYEIPLDDITDVTLLEDLPDGLQRVAGTGLPTLLSGRFSADDYPRLKLALNPTAPPFLLIETSEQIYLIGTTDPKLTNELYETLNQN